MLKLNFTHLLAFERQFRDISYLFYATWQHKSCQRLDYKHPFLLKRSECYNISGCLFFYDHTELTDHGFHKNDRILEDEKNSAPDSLFDVEVTSSSSSLLESELSITTTCANKVREKQFVNAISEGCETDHTSAGQECSFLIAQDNLEDISSHFERGNRVNHDEEMDITFSDSEYQIGDKEIGQFLYEGNYKTNLNRSKVHSS